jgi:hypothetical protein
MTQNCGGGLRDATGNRWLERTATPGKPVTSIQKTHFQNGRPGAPITGFRSQIPDDLRPDGQHADKQNDRGESGRFLKDCTEHVVSP